MTTYLHIKGSNLWKWCALLILGIVITCCGTDVTSLVQPTGGVVGKPISITMSITYCSPSSYQANLVVAVLLPIGWQGAKNMTMTYNCPTVGSGVLNPMPSTVTERQSGLNWPQALLNKFGIDSNYIDNMQWVVFESDKTYNMGSVNMPVAVNITLTPGADNNNAKLNPAYVVAETNDGLAPVDTYISACTLYKSFEYYELINGPTFTLTGGIPGTNIDYADRQYSTVNPGAALIDDFITVTFYDNIIPTTVLLGDPVVYLNATAYTTDGTAYPAPVTPQTLASTQLTETSSTSNIYQISLWPRAYFNLPANKTLSKIEYTISDAAGDKQVGFNNTATPFEFTFVCEEE
jgi:hypothetical protein